MSPVSAMVKDCLCYPADDLYTLFEDVYALSETMSETLEEKYPNPHCLVDDLKVLTRLPGGLALAAEMDSKPMAYAFLRPRKQSRLRHTAELSMGVAQAARGMGLGRLVLNTVLDRCRDAAIIEIVYLMVRADNVSALRLYERSGFESLAILTGDTKIGECYFDGVLMRKRLHP